MAYQTVWKYVVKKMYAEIFIDLLENDAKTMSEIARHHGVNYPNLSKVFGEMRKDGLLEFNKESQAYDVTLTDTGEQLARALRKLPGQKL